MAHLITQSISVMVVLQGLVVLVGGLTRRPCPRCRVCGFELRNLLRRMFSCSECQGADAAEIVVPRGVPRKVGCLLGLAIMLVGVGHGALWLYWLSEF